MNNRKSLQARDIGQLDNNQEATDKKIISGYFIVFNSETELYEGCFEEIAPESFDNVDLSSPSIWYIFPSIDVFFDFFYQQLIVFSVHRFSFCLLR